ncbi:hypothetical protein TUBRATIS_10370 [Tubulinosema ratisbonensis]|uniref:Uncharacterized protein n=1 Tax=Tubulinosema ratisbonensis TaxID=291195 RepID=A0A437AMM5_9MICR|nr:hypothetical protein TUBRATIS_10370 [Tubulinosema ratisbonensis]
MFIYIGLSFSYLLRLMTKEYYIGNLGSAIPKATDLKSAINFTFKGFDDYDGGMFLERPNGQLIPNRFTNILQFVPLNPYSIEEENMFFIVIDPKSGFNRILNGKKCVEWMTKENNFKIRPCAHVDEQLFEVVDVGS